MLYIPEDSKKVIMIKQQYFIKLKYKGYPEPKKASSLKLQLKGNYYFSTLLLQHTQ